MNDGRKHWLWGLAILAVASPLSASYVFKQRCSDDSLDVTQAIERIEWAARCKHISPEDRHDALFSGANNAARPRPQYPIFATDNLASVWKAPVNRAAACDVPAGYTVQGFCTSSCYTPDQAILFPTGFEAILDAKNRGVSDVMTLGERSTMDRLELMPRPIESYTQEIRDTWHDILVFQTMSGGELKVTPNHPLVDRRGFVRAAETFKTGEALVHYQRGPDTILSVSKEKFFGKVYNLAPQATALVSHILVAQGFLNGSSYYQNDGADNLNRRVLRRRIPRHLYSE